MNNLKEDKELLLKDLCARLPYGVKLWHESYVDLITLHSIDATHCGVEISIDSSDSGTPWWNSIEQVKPYLFPLSSMTEEQKKFFKDRPIFLDSDNDLVVKEDFLGNSQFTMLDDWVEVILWLVKNHFDYRGLIPKGVAIDCTNLNIY